MSGAFLKLWISMIEIVKLSPGTILDIPDVMFMVPEGPRASQEPDRIAAA